MRPQRQNAQALVEFALLAPLFFIVLLGLLDFGRAIYFYSSLSHAAREAARFAVARDHSGATDVTIRQQSRLDLFSVPVDQSTSCSPDLCAIPSLPTTNLTYVQVSPTYDQRLALASTVVNPGVTTRYPLTVTLTFYFQPITPIISSLVGRTVVLTSQTTMVTEY